MPAADATAPSPASALLALPCCSPPANAPRRARVVFVCPSGLRMVFLLPSGLRVLFLLLPEGWIDFRPKEPSAIVCRLQVIAVGPIDDIVMKTPPIALPQS